MQPNKPNNPPAFPFRVAETKDIAVIKTTRILQAYDRHAWFDVPLFTEDKNEN